jgi:hypothetical protein
LTLHAEKALNKKLWYLRDQGTVATTNPADRQTGLQRPMADQKDQLLQEESPHPVLIKPTVKDQQKNTAANARAKKDLFHHPEASPIKAAVTSPQAVLQEGRQARRNPFHQKAGPIPADQQIMMIGQKEALAANRPGKKDHFRKRAGLIQAGQRIMMKGQKEAPIAFGAVNLQAKSGLFHQKASHIQADQMKMTKGPKEVLGLNHPKVKGHSHPAESLPQVHLKQMTGLKEVLGVKNQVKKNSPEGPLLIAASKNVKGINLIAPTGRSVQNQATIK